MKGFKWTPRGGDGADSGEIPVSSEDARNIKVARDAFKRMVIAVDSEDNETAHAIWQDMVEQVAGSVNPYGLLVQVGIIFNAIIVRNLAGDSLPAGPPNGHLNVTVLGWNETTESIVDTPLADFAATAIVHAANWQWQELNDMMIKRLDEASDSDDFLHDLAAILMSMFIGVGGLEQTGWSR